MGAEAALVDGKQDATAELKLSTAPLQLGSESLGIAQKQAHPGKRKA